MRRWLPILLVGCAADDTFYTDPVPGLAQMVPGDVARFERIGHTARWTVGLKADVYRVLYRTTGLDGAPDVASARLAIPDALLPDQPAAIVAHLHGTVGLADRCAPSRDKGFGFESSSNPVAAQMVARGHVVVEPDYLGLGTPGPHAYVARIPTATSVHDSIHAAARFEDLARGIRRTAPTAVVVEGHSQGGHAVLATLAAAAEAPDLPFVAGVALSPPGRAGPLVTHLAEENRWGGFVAMALVGWVDAHPELGVPADWLADDTLLERLEQDCLLGLSGLIEDPLDDFLDDELVAAFRAGDFDAVGLGDVVRSEDLGQATVSVPVDVFHGTQDELLPIALTEALADELAATNPSVVFHAIDGGDHLFLPHKARDEVLAALDNALR